MIDFMEQKGTPQELNNSSKAPRGKNKTDLASASAPRDSLNDESLHVFNSSDLRGLTFDKERAQVPFSSPFIAFTRPLGMTTSMLCYTFCPSILPFDQKPRFCFVPARKYDARSRFQIEKNLVGEAGEDLNSLTMRTSSASYVVHIVQFLLCLSCKISLHPKSRPYIPIFSPLLLDRCTMTNSTTQVSAKQNPAREDPNSL
ncbi:hypothetical protein E2542_SST28944 [Spatholobus suberectus]|nr:hypothetical protein E2542_SST28944 [Spatholobus suberectus]